MEKSHQITLAQRFHEMHHADKLLVLPNAWDAGSAVIFQQAGFPAIGTTSAGVAYSLGYPDGEYITRADSVDATQKISRRLQVPLTVDIEGGFGETTAEIVETVRQTIHAGAIGINIEDSHLQPTPSLVKLDDHCQTIAALKNLKTEIGIPFFINIRLDVFWLQIGDPAKRLDVALERANAYLAAGADGVFTPSIYDRRTLQTLVSEIPGPLNVLASPECPPIPELEAMGVARISIGSGAVRSALGLTQKIAQELYQEGTWSNLQTAMPYAAANELMELR